MDLLSEVVGQILFSFTRSVTEHYNPEEPEFTAEFYGYDPLESTGREWYYQPVDELIYQEYSDREATTWDYLGSSVLDIKVINACLPDEVTDEHQEDDRAMAWKRLRPSAVCTVGKSMCIGALISVLAAIVMGTLYTLICYARFKSLYLSCHHSHNSTSVQMQWKITISGVIGCGFYYIWPFTFLLLLFRPFQLIGIKRTLFLVCFLCYCLDALYRVACRALTLSHVSISSFLTWFPLNAMLIISICLEMYVVANHFCPLSRTKSKLTLFFQMIVPVFLTFFIGQIGQYFIYPAYADPKNNNQDKLLIALFFPLIVTILKVIARVCVQRLYNISHPGYSYVLLGPLFYGLAVISRALQADLDTLEYIAILGIIHGAAEVIERSTMVFIDHICHVLWKRKSAPWGSFRTPRRERLMADIAIMSMLSESTAIVSVNGFIYLHKFLCLKDNSVFEVLQLFAKCTSVQLVIEWFFTSVSLAIETRYQNLAVMAVLRRRWKRHILVAIVNVIPLAVYTSEDLLRLVSGQF